MDFNAQSLAKSRRNSFENSTSRGTREVQRTSLFSYPRAEECVTHPLNPPPVRGTYLLGQSPSMPKSFLNLSGRSSKIVHRGVREKSSGLLSYPRAESFSLLRLGRLVCVWLLSACADNCLHKMRWLKIIFRHRIFLIQQSSIATALFRFPLGFCRRSI